MRRQRTELCRAKAIVRGWLVMGLLAGALACVPLSVAASAEPERPVRVTVDGGRVSVAAEGTAVEEIVRAIGDETGISITAVNADRLEATVAVERETVERALELVVYAIAPAARTATVFSYDGDRLRAAKVVFPRSGGEGPVDEGADEDRAGGDGSLTEEQRRIVTEALRAAGVPDTHIDLIAAEQMAEAGVSLPEIVDVLRADARAAAGLPATEEPTDAAAVMEPLSEVDRRMVAAELRAAGLPEEYLDEARLLAARQLISAGVAMAEIVEQLRGTVVDPAVSADAAAEDPPTPVVVAAVTGDLARALTAELRQAGVPANHLDESTLFVAHHLKAAGLPIEDIRDQLLVLRANPQE